MNKDYNNNTTIDISEFIVIHSLYKIISVSVYKSENKKINSQIPKCCYNYTKNILDNIISWNSITYDKDEIRNENKTKIKNNINYNISQCNNLSQILSNNHNNNLSSFQINNSYIDENYNEQKLFSNLLNIKNNWDFCEEPKSNNNDRYISSLIIIKKAQKENKIKIVKEEKDEYSIQSKKSIKSPLKVFNSSKNIRITSIFKSLFAKEKKPTINKDLNDIMNELSFHSIKHDKDDENRKNYENIIDFNQLRKDYETQKKINKIDLKK